MSIVVASIQTSVCYGLGEPENNGKWVDKLCDIAEKAGLIYQETAMRGTNAESVIYASENDIFYTYNSLSGAIETVDDKEYHDDGEALNEFANHYCAPGYTNGFIAKKLREEWGLDD